MTRPTRGHARPWSRLGRLVDFEGAPALAAMTGAYTVMLYLSTVTLARLLGPHEYGGYAVVMAATAMIGTLATPGIEHLLTRDLSILRAQHNYGYARGLIRLSNRFVLGTSVVLALALCVVAQVVYSDPEPRLVMSAGSLLIPLGALARVRAATVTGLGSVVLARLPELLLRPVALFALIGAWLLLGGTFHAVDAVSVTVLAGVVSFLLGQAIARSVIGGRVPASEPRYALPRWRRAAAPFFLLAVADVLTGQIGVVLVQALGSSADAGLYAIASRGAAVVALGFVGVSATIGPSAARHWANGDPAGLLRLVRRMAFFSIAFAIPTATLMAVFASPLLNIIGHEFTPAASALRVMCLGQLGFATFGVFGTVLLMTGQEALASGIMLGGLAFGLALNLVLIPPFGVTGAAVANAVGFIVCYVAMAIALWRRWPRIAAAIGASDGVD